MCVRRETECLLTFSGSVEPEHVVIGPSALYSSFGSFFIVRRCRGITTKTKNACKASVRTAVTTIKLVERTSCIKK